jgi:hypothetical protein
MTMHTNPVDVNEEHTAPLLAIAPYYKDPQTSALYVHEDLKLQQGPWAEEAHIKPPRADERIGDIESWTAYVQRYSSADRAPLLTWNGKGLRAILDYHVSDEAPGRCQWVAVHPFVTSAAWDAWMKLANGQPISQRAAIERLEDLAPDITDPSPTDLTNLLRTLRASVNAKADTELRADGTTKVSFSKDQTVKSGSAEGSVDLPPEFRIGIQVLKGHVETVRDEKTAEERLVPVVYALAVRLRVTVDDNAHLAFRFSIPLAERTLEYVYADRVAAAKKILGDSYELLRAAD